MPTTIITDRELGRGLDGFHPETKLTEGFTVQATNWLPSYSGSLVRRKGYQRVGGWPPVRVESATRSGTTITLTLSSSLSTAGLTPSPIALHARMIQYGTANTTFGGIGPTPVLWYFPTFSIVSPTQISVSGSPITNTGYSVTVVPGASTPVDYSGAGFDAYIWGLPSDWLVTSTDASRTTWVTGLLSYNYLEESTPLLVVGRKTHTLGTDSGGSYPNTTVSASATASGAQVVGRAIYGAVPAVPPTRGYAVSTGIGSTGYLAVASSTYSTGTGYTTYVLSAPGLILSGAVAGIIRPSIDLLTVTQSSRSQLDGEFSIVSVSSTPTTITVECVNAANAAPGIQFSDSGGAARAGVFTDTTTVGSGARILPGDLLVPASLVSEPPDWTCVSAGTTSIVIDGTEESTTHPIGNGELITATRTSRSLPVASVTGVVRGDCVSVVGYEEQFVVVSISPGADVSTAVTGDGFLGTLTVASTLSYHIGDVVSLWNAGPFTGDVVVSSIVDGTTLEFSTAAAGSSAGTIMGTVVHLDSPLSVSNGTGMSVPVRWVPAPSPDYPRNSIGPTLTRQYDFPEGGTNDAAFVAGAQVGGSLYSTNEFDSVQKFDGAASYRSGLPNWNPLLGLEIHNRSSKLINNPGSSAAGTLAASGVKVTTTAIADAALFPVGSNVVVVNTTAPGVFTQWPSTVNSNDPTTGIVALRTTVDASLGIDGNACILYPAIQFRYYFRWVGRDANGQVVASAAAASQDTTVVFGAPVVVSMKLATMAVSGSRLYSSIELEIYRTGTNSADAATNANVADGSPPFYRIAVIPLKYAFDSTPVAGVPIIASTRYYELYEDANQVELGSSGGTDVVSQALSGGTKAGAYWDEPPRAVAAATMNGRLLLANIRSWPQQDVAVRESPARVLAFSFSDMDTTRCVFRRDGTTASTTDVANVQAYEFRVIPQADSATYRSSVFVISRNPGQITFVVTTPFSVSVGGWVHSSLFLAVPGSTQSGQGGLDFIGWFQVLSTAPSGSYAGKTEVTCLWPEKNRHSITNVTANILSVDGGVVTNYGTGTPVFLGLPTPTGLSEAVQYWTIPVTATTFKLASSIENAKTGAALAVPNQSGSFPISVGYLPGIGNSTLLCAVNGLDIPVPVILAPNRGVGTYSPLWPIRTTSTDLQLAIDLLSRAINATQSGVWLSPNNGDTRDAWLLSNSGADYPFGTARVRTTSDSSTWTVEWEGTTDDSGVEKFLVYAGDSRIPNFSFPSTGVFTTTPYFIKVDHGLVPGQTVRLTASAGGALPAPFVAGTPYYAVVQGSTQFAVSATPGGGPIQPTTTGSGNIKLRAEVAAEEARFPSRIVRSYPNYPEIFDNPYASLGDVAAGNSDAVIDVNPSDGDEITQIRPFYAQSFTIAAQQEARLVTFKNRTVYMVNVETGEIQQIQTNGHGAEFGRSVADTRNGLMYADTTGLHKINRQSEWLYQGQILGRLWDEDFDPTAVPADVPVALGAAKHNRYQLAMLEAGASVPTQVIVYDYTREVGGENGAWTIFDDYPTTAWTEFSGRSYHGDRRGLVYVDRQTEDDSDYRDDSGAYTSTVLLRAMDFGALGSRKRLARISIQFRRSGAQPVEDIAVTIAIDGQTTRLPADSVILQYSPPDTNLSDDNQKSVYSISFTPPIRKAEYYQVGISISALDEPLEICQIAYHVELLSEHGVVQAGQTT